MFKMKHTFREGDAGGDGTGGASGGNDDFKAKFEAMEVQFQEQAEELNRLRSHSKKLLDEKKQLKSNLDKFDGIDIEKLLQQFDSNEEAKLIAENKFDEVVNRRMEKTLLEWENRLNEANKKLEQSDTEKTALQSRYNNAVVNNHLRAAAEKAGVLPSAIDDVLARANGTFTVLDNGEIEARNADGSLRTVKSKPLSPELFVDDLKEVAPHYWPASQSGGANGGSGRGGKQENPFLKGSPQFNVTEQAKLRKSDPQLAEQLEHEAKAAAN